ncbi:MAG TPA: NIPSNAP family protein [Dehalococcoidia bacterium]|nr:NIPSNAP family protein [Dehalococcoidia bacterium]
MIYEVRSYILKVDTVGKFEERFAEPLPEREQYSPLAAFWHTEVGPLNQVIHVWAYEDLGERDRVRKTVAKEMQGRWPPKVGEFLVSQEAEIFTPAPFMKPLVGKDFGSGNIYEMRTYTCQPGSMPRILERWGEVIEEREKISPLVACWYSELGGLNKFVHTWVYKDFEERERVRQKAFSSEFWPPKTAEWLLKQENKIMVGASFSKLR